MRYKYHPPFLVKRIFNDFIWKTLNNKVLLTFDDGPTEAVTIKILNILKSNNIKGVFFCIGHNVKKYPDLTNKILEDGHTIANHTMNHKVLTKLNREESVEELSSFNSLMKKNFNYDVKYFRPPYGRINLTTNNLLNELHLKCIMWNLLTYDFENSFEKVKHSINNYLRKNSIIVFHDNVKCNDIIEESLYYTIEQASIKGFELGEPKDCLK